MFEVNDFAVVSFVDDLMQAQTLCRSITAQHSMRRASTLVIAAGSATCLSV
jgi:hypothetical protein